MSKELEILHNFIEEFYEKIDNDFINLMKKDKVKKISVGKYGIDAIDYMDGTKTPLLETIKYNLEDGVKIYFQNKEIAPTGYSVEDIFHSFSIAALADAVIGTHRYVKKLEDFYQQAEEITRQFLEPEDKINFDISGEEFEVIAVSSENEKFSLVIGICKEIQQRDGRIYFLIEEENKEHKLVHIVETNAADVAMVLKHVFQNEEN
ncbi:hypothetical protein H3N56_01305 [Cetobacterium sp. 2A]|uniref:hypothetical protein n=1 Tax=Cetobacterium sp. 2A TaxID=2754723 RepID=UPI00163C8881|nr:hypothetical protein [Cetobacterium sp. 2A]MBC2855131.1 hypothetical protein [Cetobacterium sp. 2A]